MSDSEDAAASAQRSARDVRAKRLARLGGGGGGAAKRSAAAAAGGSETEDTAKAAAPVAMDTAADAAPQQVRTGGPRRRGAVSLRRKRDGERERKEGDGKKPKHCPLFFFFSLSLSPPPPTHIASLCGSLLPPHVLTRATASPGRRRRSLRRAQSRSTAQRGRRLPPARCRCGAAHTTLSRPCLASPTSRCVCRDGERKEAGAAKRATRVETAASASRQRCWPLAPRGRRSNGRGLAAPGGFLCPWTCAAPPQWRAVAPTCRHSPHVTLTLFLAVLPVGRQPLLQRDQMPDVAPLRLGSAVSLTPVRQESLATDLAEDGDLGAAMRRVHLSRVATSSSRRAHASSPLPDTGP